MNELSIKISYSLPVLLASIIMVACNTSIQKPIDINGKWIDTKNGNVLLRIDELKKIITIDYSISGGKIFTSKYETNANNEIIADVLPKGAKVEMDKEGLIKFYPLSKEYHKDIEVIYSVKFKRQ